jgi:hypothetical protein
MLWFFFGIHLPSVSLIGLLGTRLVHAWLLFGFFVLVLFAFDGGLSGGMLRSFVEGPWV